MPRAALRPCPARGCSRLTRGGRCDVHRKEQRQQADTKTPEERAFYSSAAWQKIRAAQLQREPLCRTCREEGRPLTPASTADHIVPRRQGGSDLPENLQSQCGPCHQRKRQAERAPLAAVE